MHKTQKTDYFITEKMNFLFTQLGQQISAMGIS